jgi:hypothetical protein
MENAFLAAMKSSGYDRTHICRRVTRQKLGMQSTVLERGANGRIDLS